MTTPPDSPGCEAGVCGSPACQLDCGDPTPTVQHPDSSSRDALLRRIAVGLDVPVQVLGPVSRA